MLKLTSGGQDVYIRSDLIELIQAEDDGVDTWTTIETGNSVIAVDNGVREILEKLGAMIE